MSKRTVFCYCFFRRVVICYFDDVIYRNLTDKKEYYCLNKAVEICQEQVCMDTFCYIHRSLHSFLDKIHNESLSDQIYDENIE